MKNKNEMALLPFKKEQLYSERAFIQHCIYDYHQNRKLDDINESFLRAAESDGFLHPLLQVEEESIQKDGSKKNILVNYYSPHQIYIVAALSKNQIHEGLLWASQDLEFYKQQGFRMVNWGWSGYAFTIQQKNKGLRVVEQKQIGDGYLMVVEDEKNMIGSRPDHLKVCNDFHNFLILLHSLKQLQYSFTNDRKRDRLFSQAPSLYFDLSPLRTESEKTLKQYKLDLEKLKILAYNVASLATDIDPLEYWYYYINRHSQLRKDLFKGDAALAQELYRIYDLLIEMIEVVSGVKQPPLFELMYGQKGIRPYLMPSREYVSGTDVKSMWIAIKEFKEWIKSEGNKDFVEDNTTSRLDDFEKELTEYEKKYGAKSFISNGVREVEIEDNLKIEDLDQKTKNYVEQIIRQAKSQQAESKRQFLSFWDDELEERIKKKEITLKDAKKEDYELFVKREIFAAIENRLRELHRELWAIFNTVYEKIAKKTNEAWDIEHNFSNYFWFKRREELKTLPKEKQSELYDKAYKKAYKEAKHWSEKRDEFGNVEYIMELLFCSACRKKPVSIHQSHLDDKISNSVICDDCIKSTNDLKTIKQAEWRCDFCKSLLYKFAHNNMLDTILLNSSSAGITLEYGRMRVKVKCQKCRQENFRWIDWGWTE